MGEQKVVVAQESANMKRFVKNLLRDVEAFDYMLENNWFENDITRIGAEQEMCLVDANSYKPATLAMPALERMKDLDWVVTELAKFNLEVNLDPHVFKGDCMSKMENELNYKLNIIRDRIKDLNAKIILTGILPTLRKFDLDINNLTPKPRYYALIESINKQLEGSAFELKLSGIDELQVKHDSPLLEACNTSFQVHLQVAPKDFVKMYNIAQTLAAPMIAVSANSPVLFGKRLWHETRIALFQQALDTRTSLDHMRQRSPRVNFGTGWLENSILEIYKEDITRFRVLLSGDEEEDAFEQISKGITPKLRALLVHNSTVYRWNRPCYGISPNGKPHLRIENRVMPAGPTVIDEVSNAAFWLGAMMGMAKNVDDIKKHLSFEDIRDNFAKAASFGIDSQFNWMKDKKITAGELIVKELLPLAKEGLKMMEVDSKDSDRYLGIIEERSKKHMTGARWQLRAFTKLINETSRDEAVTTLTYSIVANQEKEIPVHNWKMPQLDDFKDYKPSKLTVEEFMVTDLFTVQQDDIIDLVADVLNWRKVRYAPVENQKGELVGLITSRILLRHFSKAAKGLSLQDTFLVKDLMKKNPITVSPQTTIMQALELMSENRIGCLPVTKGKELIGIITEMDFLRISSRLMKRLGIE